MKDADDLKDFETCFSLLDKLLEHRGRLAIVSLLMRIDQISFKRFKALLNETDGNLGAQLRKLEDAGYIKVDKVFANRKPNSWYSITPKGTRAAQRHWAALRELFGESTDSNEPD